MAHAAHRTWTINGAATAYVYAKRRSDASRLPLFVSVKWADHSGRWWGGRRRMDCLFCVCLQHVCDILNLSVVLMPTMGRHHTNSSGSTYLLTYDSGHLAHYLYLPSRAHPPTNHLYTSLSRRFAFLPDGRWLPPPRLPPSRPLCSSRAFTRVLPFGRTLCSAFFYSVYL